MKVYLSTAGIWEAPGKQSKGAEKIDVPTDTAGLVAFLNTQSAIDNDYGPEPEFDEVDEPAPQPPAKQTYVDTFNAAKHAERQSQFRTDEILDFILDTASVNQVSAILSAIGTRFAELVKGNRA